MKRLVALLLSVLMLIPMLAVTASAAQKTGIEAYIDENGDIACIVNGTEGYKLSIEGLHKIIYTSQSAVFLTASTMEGEEALFLWNPLLSAQDSTILIS